MSVDFELFKGKTMSSLFEDIYNNQIQKKAKISELIVELKKMVRHAGDMAVIGPIIKDLIDTSVRNDDQLIKLANLAQKLVSSEKKSEGMDGFLSEFEKQQLLKDIEDAQKEIERVDDLENEIEELKQKVK
jgi:hypothetical protein